MQPHDLRLGKFSLGIGDRFGLQAEAQLRACLLAEREGVEIVPVWNKSNREHRIISSQPVSVRVAAEAAVRNLGWRKPWHIDADHIRLDTVEPFLSSADFYTIDVADAIGKAAAPDRVQAFVDQHLELLSPLFIPGIEGNCATTRGEFERAAKKYLGAVQEAGAVYRHIERAKGPGRFITEISMDETDSPQTPGELLMILAAIADERIPIQTIAPRFTGFFHKGVDYQGDLARFETEFDADLCVIRYAIQKYGLPETLKLSVHSGSDKFSLYPGIGKALKKRDMGLHLKTAGTSWLEELLGLAEAGGDGLKMAKEIYRQSYEQREQLCVPYANVVHIEPSRLPTPEMVETWSSGHYVNALYHDRLCPVYNPDLRQLLHVGFQVAAQLGPRYLKQVKTHAAAINPRVTRNLLERHIRPLFLNSHT